MSKSRILASDGEIGQELSLPVIVKIDHSNTVTKIGSSLLPHENNIDLEFSFQATGF